MKLRIIILRGLCTRKQQDFRSMEGKQKYSGSFNISDDAEKLVMLPKQLEAVARATTIPKEVHRWNTNEVNPILDLIFISPFILCKRQYPIQSESRLEVFQINFCAFCNEDMEVCSSIHSF